MLDLKRYRGEVELHRHDHAQIVLPHRGAMEIEVEGRGGLVEGARGRFIAVGATHSFMADVSGSFIVADVPLRLATGVRAFDGSSFFSVTPRLQALLDCLVVGLSEDFLSPSARSAWWTLVLDGLDLGSARRPSQDERAIERAHRHMREHLAESLPVAAIARAAGVGVTRLHALFRTSLGRTPHAILTELRLDAAESLLTSTDRPIAEIAVETGHSDQSALTRSLKNIRGVTPANLRETHRRKELQKHSQN